MAAGAQRLVSCYANFKIAFCESARAPQLHVERYTMSIHQHVALDMIFAAGIRRQPALVLGGIGTISAYPESSVLTDVSSLLAIGMADLTGPLLGTTKPGLVLSPLIWGAWDVLDAAVLLERLDFTGSYRAIAPRLPKPAMIEAEVAAMAPSIDFKILREPSAMYSENPGHRLS